MDQEQQEDTSNLMLLADVCCLELEKIRHAKIFESFVKKKRTRRDPKIMMMKMTQNRKRTAFSFTKKRVHVPSYPLKFEYEDILEATPTEPFKKRRKVGEPSCLQESECKDIAAKPSSKKMKKGKNQKKMQANNNPNRPMNVTLMEKPATPAWVEEATRICLGSTNPAVWICQKLLQKSDVNRDLNRLFIPGWSILKNLFPALTSKEKGNLKSGISVLGLDQMGHTWNLELKFSDSVTQHVFQKDWKDLVRANGFRANVDTIQVWLSHYRHGDNDEERMCFFIGREEG